MPEENNHPPKKLTRFRLILIAVSGVVFLLGIFFLIHIFKDLRKQEVWPFSRRQNFHEKQLAVEDIRSWMTFDYINRSFGLPPDYFKNNLNIEDNHYPRVTIGHWAKESRQNSEDLVAKIRLLITNFHNSKPPLPDQSPASLL
jgi:hypothetical protein